jgi:hypothetical protein
MTDQTLKLDTTLDEIARLINEATEQGSTREEIIALGALFREYAAAIHKPVSDDLCDLAAQFILRAMVRQSMCDARSALATLQRRREERSKR